MSPRLLACAFLAAGLPGAGWLAAHQPVGTIRPTRPATPADTLRPGQQWRLARAPAPTVLLLRNVSPAGASLPVAYSLFAGCDSISSATLPEGSSSPLIISLMSGKPAAITHIGLASGSRLEVRRFVGGDSTGLPLRANAVPLSLLPYTVATTRLRTAHVQVGLSALFESARFVVIVGTAVYVCNVNTPGPATPYSTPNNILALYFNNVESKRLTIINASPSALSSGSIVVRDLCQN